MDARLIGDAIERWFRFPRVVLLYLLVPVVPVLQWMKSDPVSASWVPYVSVPLAMVAALVGGLAGVLLENLTDRKQDFFLGFHAAFIVSWLTGCCLIWCGR
jgi:hypothetical protein